MSTAQGVVESVSSKVRNTKFGPKPAYSALIEGQWYSCGFTKPRFSEGDDVSFSYTEGQYGLEMDVKTAVKTKTAATPPSGATPTAAAPAAKPAPYSGGSKGVFPIPPLDGQRAIVRQNSITNAVAHLREQLASDSALTLDDQAALIIQLARKFEAYSCGDLDAIMAKELVERKATASKKKDAPVEAQEEE